MGARTEDGAQGPPDGPDARWTVCVVSQLLHSFYFGNILVGVVEAVSRGGGRVVAVQTADSALYLRLPAASQQPPVAWEQADAFVIVHDDTVPDSYIRRLHERGKIIVLVSRTVPGLDLPTVVPDNRAGIAAAVAHLVEHGHTRIGYVGRSGTNLCADDVERFEAYQHEMLDRGLTPRLSAKTPPIGAGQSGREAALQVLADPTRPTAVIACTDVTAIDLINGLAEVDVEVPRDLAVIGFDDIEDAERTQPALSTVAQSFARVGDMAGDLAIEALRGRPVEPGYHYAPVTLVIRESCGCSDLRYGDTTTASPGDRFSEDLVAAINDGDERDQARMRDLAHLAGRIVTLFTTVARLPSAEAASVAEASACLPDLERLVEVIASQAHHLVPRDRGAMQVTALLHRLSRALAVEFAPGDAALAARLADLAFQLSAALMEEHLRARSAGYLRFQTQHGHYVAITDLLHRQNQSPHSLAWLAQTEVKAACLARWEGPRDEQTGDGTLRVVDVYDRRAGSRPSAEVCDAAAFPPASLFRLAAEVIGGGGADGDPAGDDAAPGACGCLMFVLPVQFHDSDWGLLSFVGPLRMNESAVMEMLNHWGVLLTVAADQEQAVRSLVEQREDLLAAYEREHALTDEIRVSEERYALVADAANDGLWDWNLVAGTIYYSTRWKALLGYADGDVRAAPREWLDRIHPDDREHLDRVLARQLAGEATTMELEYRMRARDGSYRWMLTRGRSVRDESGNVIRLVGSMTDITDRRQLEDRLRHDALYDALTGLPNRTLFLDRLNQAMQLSKRQPGYWFAVLFLDLDGFKVINDGLGHQVGDEVLVHVAKRLSAQMRSNDTVARFGGDEYVMLLNGVKTVHDLQPTIERILADLSTPFALGGRTLVLSASAGIAVSLNRYDKADDLIRDADTAMYRAKAIGSGTSVVFDESMHASAMARLQVESDLRNAIAQEQLELYYQPIVELSTGRTKGLEALIRWRHPARGLVSPAEFLPIAEATGLIVQIGRWTIRETCRQLREWRDASIEPTFTVSVNLSNRQFWDAELRPYLRRTIEEFDVPATQVVIEVTEGVIMHNSEMASSFMRQLRADSFKLHVDDFGTGYSSLAELHSFPIDALKIDRSFITRMMVDSRSKELVRIMIAMGRTLGMELIAEGIETEEQAAILAELGCPLVQGYLFSRPLPPAEATSFLRSGQPDRASR